MTEPVGEELLVEEGVQYVGGQENHSYIQYLKRNLAYLAFFTPKRPA